MPLKTTRRVLMWLCAWPPSQEISVSKKIGYIIFALIVFGFAIIPVMLDIYLLTISLRTGETEACFLAIYQMSVSANTAYACVLIYHLRSKINEIFEKLIDLYDTREHLFIAESNWTIIAEIKWYFCPFDDNNNSFQFVDKMDSGFEFVVQANEKSEFMWSMYLKYVVVLYFFNMTVTGVTSVLLGYFLQGHFVVSLAFHPFQFR